MPLLTVQDCCMEAGKGKTKMYIKSKYYDKEN
jgi:hypothetical protein